MREELLEAEARDQQEAVGQAMEDLKESQAREAALTLQVRELHDSIQRQSEEFSFREEMLRKDIGELERRYQAAEQRHEVFWCFDRFCKGPFAHKFDSLCRNYHLGYQTPRVRCLDRSRPCRNSLPRRRKPGLV